MYIMLCQSVWLHHPRQATEKLQESRKAERVREERETKLQEKMERLSVVERWRAAAAFGLRPSAFGLRSSVLGFRLSTFGRMSSVFGFASIDSWCCFCIDSKERKVKISYQLELNLLPNDFLNGSFGSMPLEI